MVKAEERLRPFGEKKKDRFTTGEGIPMGVLNPKFLKLDHFE